MYNKTVFGTSCLDCALSGRKAELSQLCLFYVLVTDVSMCLCVSVAETIKRVLRDYHERISSLEDEKFDLEYAVKKKDFEVEFVSMQRRVLLRVTA